MFLQGDYCCWIAMLLGCGNIVCWLVIFNKPFSLKSNGRELTIGHQNNKELKNNITELHKEIQELKEIVKNGNGKNKPETKK